jgi:hypothetical protein
MARRPPRPRLDRSAGHQAEAWFYRLPSLRTVASTSSKWRGKQAAPHSSSVISTRNGEWICSPSDGASQQPSTLATHARERRIVPI